MRIFEYEIDAICEAIRRDMHVEGEKVYTDPQWKMFHEHNVRRDIELLQQLKPKHAS